MQGVVKARQPMRLNKEALEEKIERMMDDPLILIRPETESVKKYRTHARLVKLVRHELIRKKQSEGVDVYKVVREEKELRSIMRTLTKTERSYPGILRMIFQTDNCSATATEYGITRQRVHQIKDKMKRFAKLDGSPYAGVWIRFDSV